MKHDHLDDGRGKRLDAGRAGPLVDAAALVADGSDFDLLSLSSSLSSDDERAVADELAVVARIAQAHRKLHQVLPEPEPGSDTVPFAASWGHLDLIEVVGRGSYGTVYRAWDPHLDRLVALKLFHGARNPEAVMREGRMLARIRHENVVTVHGADVYNGIAGIWMEFVHGHRLDQIVEQQGTLTAKDATVVGVAVCRALEAVHGAGLLHCDVKAQNVIRESSGRIVLMDLGAGRSTIPEDDDSTAKMQVAGTPRYMAPEVFDGGDALPQSDVYSVGVLLFYLVSARFPVDGRTLADIRRGHLEGRRVQLKDVRPDLPEPFVQDVTRALNPTATARQATPGELEAGLHGVSAALQPSPAPVVSRGRRNWIAASAAVLTVALAATVWWLVREAPPAGGSDQPRTVAVMPIRNLTGDPAKAYLADGLTEVLISNLARVKGLRVPSSSASAAFRDGNEPSAVIGEKLGVEMLLAGSILEAGDRARMVVQFIDARSDTVLWSEEMTADAADSKDLMTVQGQVARLVARRLNIALSGSEDRALQQTSVDPRAQDAFLRGLVESASKLDADIPNAASHFREATTLQPEFAAAWAQSALIELRMAQFASPDRRAEHVGAARTMATRALAIDANTPAALVALGTAQFYYEWNFAEAERSYDAALEIDPSNVVAQQYLSGLLSALNRVTEAIAVAEESVRLEPLMPTRRTNLGMMYYYGRDYPRALAQMEQALRLSPGYPLAYAGLSRIHTAMGRHSESAVALERALASGRNMAWLAELGCIYAAADRHGDLRRVQSELAERALRGEHVSLDHAAHVAAAESRIDEGFRALEESVASREPDALWLLVDPRLDAFRRHPRYIQLLKQAGLQ